MHQIIAYIKFLFRSKNQHGVHSPFVFDLVTKCFYDKKEYPSYELISAFQKELQYKKEHIEVTDFGAGSKVFGSGKRRISEIALNAGISPKRARLINRLVPYLGIKNALELGTSVGAGTAAISAGNNVQITTIEGCPKTAEIAEQLFDKFGCSNVTLKKGEFDEVLEEMLSGNSSSKEPPKFDLIYFDGNHQKEATVKYFQKLLPTIHNNSVWIFDDIHWSKEMEAAWNEIKAQPEVRVTIDTFFWGFVFFRKEQEKEDFVIRI
ncbi:MAG: class I SAM-dependent methyltransferase [Salinimicrobium sp.]